MHLTVYRSVTDNVGVHYEVSWEQLTAALGAHETRATKGGGLYNLVRFANKRRKAGAISASGLVLDFDHISQARALEVVAALRPIAYQAHSTHSSQHNDPAGEVCMRVIVPFSRDVTPAEFEIIWSQFKAFLPDIDPKCRDISHFYYTPANRPGVTPFALVNHGPVLDVAALVRDSQAEPASRTMVGEVERSSTDRGVFYRLLANRDAIISEVEDGKWWVTCPNAANHGTTGDTDTVLWAPRQGETLGVLSCSHAHCSELRDKAWFPFFTEEELAAVMPAQFTVSTGAFAKVIKKLARSKGRTAAAFEKLAQGLAYAEPDQSELTLAWMLQDLARELPKADPASVAAHFGSSLSFMALKGEVPDLATVAAHFKAALDARRATGEEIDLLRTSSGTPKPGVENIRRILEGDAELVGRYRLNQFNDRITVEENGETRELSENDLTKLRERFENRYGLYAKPSDVMAGIASAAARYAWHPVRDYLGSLTWDGVPRLETWLVEHFGAADTPYTRMVSSWWLQQAVARIYEPGCQADYTLIFQGATGVGKSQALAHLASRDWFSDDIRDIGERSAAEQLSGKWIIELAELASVRRADNEKVKGWLTRCVDRYRVSYARLAQDFKRQCVTCGSTNEQEYLTDTTGNRRYWPVKVANNDVDIAALDAVRDQLWAEAVVKYRAGEVRYPVGPAVKAVFAAEVEKCRVVDEYETSMRLWLENPTGYYDGVKMSTRWLIERATGEQGPRPGEIARMNNALFRLGFTRAEGDTKLWIFPPWVEISAGPRLAPVLPLRTEPTAPTAERKA